MIAARNVTFAPWARAKRTEFSEGNGPVCDDADAECSDSSSEGEGEEFRHVTSSDVQEVLRELRQTLEELGKIDKDVVVAQLDESVRDKVAAVAESVKERLNLESMDTTNATVGTVTGGLRTLLTGMENCGGEHMMYAVR